MAMTIMNNLSAMMTLGELNKNNSALEKQLKKVSSGWRINSAGDDASGYAISEKMRTRLRSLDQDIRNTQTGSSMLRVAEGGVQSIIEELRTIKELALNAANDHNTDLDRATIQKEVDNRLANIDDIAVETNYNGKRLLDGSIRCHKYRPVAAKPPEMPSQVFTVTQSGGTLTIDQDGVYDFSGFNSVTNPSPSVVNITAQNVVLKGNGNNFLNMKIVCQTSSTNLWNNILRLEVVDEDSSAIKFLGSNNTLNLLGSRNTINRTAPRGFSTDTFKHALIHIGGGLTLFNHSMGAMLEVYEICHPSTSHMGPLLGLDAGEQNSKAYIDFVLDRPPMGYYDFSFLHVDYSTVIPDSALIGAGVGGTLGSIRLIEQNQDSTRPSRVIATISSATKEWTEKNTFSANEVYKGNSIITEPARAQQVEHYGAELPKDEFLGLRIHTGTRANETLAVTIESMKTEDIGISGLKVVTQKKATTALDVIDNAIDYVLDQATHIGAYISRLEFTESNLTTASESTQSSESTMRDADMAKEMAEYTKANVLAQAAQSMLAQANQNSSQVMSLLQ